MNMKTNIVLIFVVVCSFMLLKNNHTYEIIPKRTYKTYTNDLKTDKDLKVYANKFLKEYFKIESIDIPIEFNYIPENKEENLFIHGTFITDDKLTPNRIIINPYNNDGEKQDSHNIERTLIHELTHYALCYYEIEFKDGTKIFESLNNALGGRSNNPEIKAKLLDTKINSDCCS